MPLAGPSWSTKGALSSPAAPQGCGTAALVPSAGSGLLPEQLHPLFWGPGVQNLPQSWGRKGPGATGVWSGSFWLPPERQEGEEGEGREASGLKT